MGRCPNCLEEDSINREKRYFGGWVCICARCNYVFREDDDGNDPWTLNAVEKAGQATMIGVMARKGNLEETRRAVRIGSARCPTCDTELYMGMADGSYAFSQAGRGTHYCCSMCKFTIPREVIGQANLPDMSKLGAAFASLGVDTKIAMEAARIFGVSLRSPKRVEQAKPRKPIQSKSTKVRRRIIL